MKSNKSLLLSVEEGSGRATDLLDASHGWEMLDAIPDGADGFMSVLLASGGMCNSAGGYWSTPAVHEDAIATVEVTEVREASDNVAYGRIVVGESSNGVE